MSVAPSVQPAPPAQRTTPLPRRGRLDGKVALVTGGATGIGEAIAKRFALEGARVVVSGLPDDPVDAVVREIRERGGEAVGHKGDVAEVVHAEACVRRALDEYGRLDVLVNNAGVFLEMAPTEEYSVESFDRTLRNNVRSAWLMTRFALPHLQRSKGNVVCAGSESGFLGLAENTAYGGTKGWMHAFVRGLAVEQARHGVRVNAVCPGPIDTAWTRQEEGPMTRKHEAMLLAATPLMRRGTPEEVANVYLFLASDEASFVTGALWLVDGGITAAKGAAGLQTGLAPQEEPAGTLDLRHTHEGLQGKPVKK